MYDRVFVLSAKYLVCVLALISPSLGRSLITYQNHLLVVRLFVIIKTVLSYSYGCALLLNRCDNLTVSRWF